MSIYRNIKNDYNFYFILINIIVNNTHKQPMGSTDTKTVFDTHL